MLCPVCRVDLVLSDKQGVEIDYCPQCRGIWLDRGELDKLIEKNASYEATARPAADYPPQAPAPGYAQPAPWGGYNEGHHGEGRHGGGHGGGGHGGGGHGGYRPGGFLGGLFRH
jgi:Zn-finger nucleic acid-binding protein|nr:MULTISPECIES: zf-TFIIB domain-containing protein [Sphingomonas]